jgi:outer membrane lipoprotein-sorting protein
MNNRHGVLVPLMAVLLFGPCGFSQKSYGLGGEKNPVKTMAVPIAKALKPDPTPPAPALSLEDVLTKMDQQAASFRNAQANFVWDQYTRIVDDHDLQEGTIYFRRAKTDEMQMAADIKTHNGKPIAKIVLFTDGMVKLYEPQVHRVTEYNAGKNKAEFESFLVLGFGGSGHDLLKSFDVKYQGTEKVQGVDAAKLDLTPKSQKVRGMFNHIVLWIDPARGVSVQQQFFDDDANYRLAKYTDIKLNEKINDDVFKLKVAPGTDVVRPN